MRELLADQLARKVQAHGLVIWVDREGEYADVASSIAPEGVRFETFDGSWYALRRRIESAFAGERRSTMVVYTPAAVEEDPLAEIRDAGAEFKRRLSTLVRQCLAGRLPLARISEIAENARTLSEAEAAVEGAGETDVRLVGVLGARGPVDMLIDVLTGAADDRLNKAGVWDAVATLANETVGSDVVGVSDELRNGLFQHLLLCDISRVIEGSLPDALAAAWVKPSAPHRRHARKLVERLRATPAGLSAYRRLAVVADARLALVDSLDWRPGLDIAVGSPAIEGISFTRSIQLLREAHHKDALDIAERRLEVRPSWISDPASEWGGKWRTVQAIARLHAELAKADPPAAEGPGRMLAWYVEQGWPVDRAHRRLELARTELGTFGDLEDPLTAARIAYERWLDDLVGLFVSSVADHALDTAGLIRQGEVHDRFVATSSGRTAYVWVDALRYELGVELADSLRQITEKVQIHAAVAAAPTITLVGMANLLPGAVSGLKLGLDGEHLQVTVAGTRVSTVGHRRDLLRARHGSVADLDLNQASQKGEKALANAIGGADLILIRSQEVDSAGESGLLSVAWSHFQTVINLLANVIARLAQCGVDRVVITADHGFIALSQSLGAHQTVDAPAGAVGTTKRRVFIGRGGIPNQATVRIPLASCGIPGDLDLIVPRGLAVFRAGGGRQFFHGGLSPQELIVPVIVVDLTRAPEPQKLQVGITVAGKRVTTGVFGATLSFDGEPLHQRSGGTSRRRIGWRPTRRTGRLRRWVRPGYRISYGQHRTAQRPHLPGHPEPRRRHRGRPPGTRRPNRSEARIRVGTRRSTGHRGGPA